MDIVQQLELFVPQNDQEATDKQVILEYARHFPATILLRDNAIAHITSSGFIVNPTCTKALLVHHNIRGVWGWTGGHADGNPDLLQVALQEATEETGAVCTPLCDSIASVDILPVFPHYKKGKYVNTHLHLSVAYLLIAPEDAILQVKPDENSGVAWFDADFFTNEHFTTEDVALYQKLFSRARLLRSSH